MTETSLHAGLKEWYAQAGGVIEQEVEGYLIDIQCGNELIEIQTRNFSALRGKLDFLLDGYIVRVVYPVAVERWILRVDDTGSRISRRKSPKNWTVYDVFNELTSLHGAINHPNFRLSVVFVKEEQVWQDNGLGSWRRKHWSLADRRLLSVIGQEVFNRPADYARLLPAGIPAAFTTRDLHQALEPYARTGAQRRLVGRMVLALRQLGTIQLIGKQGSFYLYERVI